MNTIDKMWVLICALFVFFMQAGFTCYEVGFVRPKNVISVAIENIVTFVIATLSFFAVGYALMFGPTIHGIIGTDYWFGTHIQSPESYFKIIFQLMFAGTAVTIFSGSMSERTKTKALIISAIVVGTIIYPIYGHWIWGGQVIDQVAWLHNFGFIDYAGASVVHGTAAWIALAGIIVVGPRKDRWDKEGKIKSLGKSNIPFAALGTFILWFSWFGFNGGNLFQFNDQVGKIIMNTNISASAGVIGALIIVFFLLKNRSIMEAIFSGALGGLVAITASSNLLQPIQAFIIGLVAGAITILGSALLERLKIDDAVGAVSIHGFGSVTGLILVAFLININQMPLGNRGLQILIQIFGIFINFIWAFGISFLMFKIIDRFIGLRVTDEEEEKGLNISEYADIYTWQQAMKEQSFTEINEDLYRQIQQQNIELEKNSQLLVATQEQEREKIARDLHDSVGQLLAASKMDLGQLRKKLIEKKQIIQAGRVLDLIDSSIEEIRSITYNLKPVKLEKEGLYKSILKLGKQMESISEIKFYFFSADVCPEWGETVKLNLYRVIQEAFNNIIKHSEARKVNITFKRKNLDKYSIIIEDNGKGFLEDQQEKGLGTVTMNERMKMIGGTLSIKSEENIGTKIILEMPYEN